MPEGKSARPEGTKSPMVSLLPEAIFNYILTVEEYVFALSVCFCGCFSFPPTSYEHQFYDVMSSFTRLIMKTKYVCHGPISPQGAILMREGPNGRKNLWAKDRRQNKPQVNF